MDLTAWVVFVRPPAETRDHIVVRGDDDRTVHGPVQVTGVRGHWTWDRMLRAAGFERVSEWQSTSGGVTCTVSELGGPVNP